MGERSNTMLRQPILPSDSEISQAQASLKLLKQDRSDKHFAIGSPSGLKVPLTEAAFDLLLNVLTEISRGNAVLVVSINAELTTQEAADLLNVSRPYLVRLLDQQKIPFHMVGRHRRILFGSHAIPPAIEACSIQGNARANGDGRGTGDLASRINAETEPSRDQTIDRRSSNSEPKAAQPHYRWRRDSRASCSAMSLVRARISHSAKVIIARRYRVSRLMSAAKGGNSGILSSACPDWYLLAAERESGLD